MKQPLRAVQRDSDLNALGDDIEALECVEDNGLKKAKDADNRESDASL